MLLVSVLRTVVAVLYAATGTNQTLQSFAVKTCPTE